MYKAGMATNVVSILLRSRSNWSSTAIVRSGTSATSHWTGASIQQARVGWGECRRRATGFYLQHGISVYDLPGRSVPYAMAAAISPVRATLM